MVRVSARELINSFRGETEVDLGREFTQKLPILTIFRILGIPESDIPWTMQTGLDMLNRPPGESGPSQRAHELRAKLVDYMVDQVQGRRGGEYPDDVFGDIAQAIDVGVMQVDEIQGLTLLLIAAGMETTTSLMGTIVHSLATGQVTPDELRDVHGNFPAEAIDEFLRFDSPAQWLSRVTTRETEIHGVTLPRGSRVLMIFASANRDPREFDVADHLILTRDGSRNLAFGEGVHFCLGMPLARLEARAGIAELLATVPEFDPAGPPRRYPSHVIRGYESIPVTVSA
jgi:cytochrome P450